MTLYVDTRERKFINYIGENKINVITKTQVLPYGDFAIVGDTFKLYAIFERKTIADFVASYGERLGKFKELAQKSDKFNIYLIIEDMDNFKYATYQKLAIQGDDAANRFIKTLHNLECLYNIHIVYSANLQDTVEKLLMYCKIYDRLEERSQNNAIKGGTLKSVDIREEITEMKIDISQTNQKALRQILLKITCITEKSICLFKGRTLREIICIDPKTIYCPDAIESVPKSTQTRIANVLARLYDYIAKNGKYNPRTIYDYFVGINGVTERLLNDNDFTIFDMLNGKVNKQTHKLGAVMTKLYDIIFETRLVV